MPKVAFEIIHPDKRSTNVVFASPHSGCDYPASLLKRTVLDRQAIRSSEDAFVDKLFDCAPRFGAPLLLAGAPRAYIDLNRSAEELDPALIEGVRGGGHNPRIASGLGIVPRVVANGRAIYRGKISLAEAQRRINGYWVPYHQQLEKLLDESHVRFGEAILIDCHSMPHEALDNIVRSGAPRPDIVLGDRFGAAAASDIVDQIEAAFRDAGLRVSRNTPFAGAYTAQHYGRPSRHQHTVQVEIDRSLYMDERAIRPNGDFAAFRRLLRGIVGRIAEIGAPAGQLAAE